MITDVELFFIQSHKHTTIQPSEGVTVIKGPSHSGKSSIIRGFSCLFSNRPRITKLKSHFATDKDEVSIGVNFKEDTFVVRRNNENENAYDIPNTTLFAIGTDVPEEVSNITKMSHINIQSQHDGYFMLNESAGKVGKELNDIVGLSIINESFKKCDKIVNKAVSDLAYCEQTIKEEEIKLEVFKNIDRVKTLANEIESLISKHTNLGSRTEELSSLIAQIKEQQNKVDSYKQFLSIVPKYNEIEKMITDYRAKEIAVIKLDDLIGTIIQEQSDIAILTEWLMVIPLYEEIKGLITKYNAGIVLRNTLNLLCLTIRKEQNVLKTAQHDLSVSQEAYDLFIKKHKNICPLCLGKGTIK